MKKIIWLMLTVVMIAGILAGCSGKPAENNVGGTPESTPPVSDIKGNDEQTSEESSWPRTYVDALGREVLLEKKPERVAQLFFRNLEHMFLLDEFPYAAADVSVLNDWAIFEPYEERNNIIDIGASQTPNIEMLLEIEPDLIIIFKGRYEQFGEELEKIAPVITVDSNENDWQGALREYGLIFGKEEKAEKEIERIEKQISDFRHELEAYNDKSFGVIMLGDKQYWAFTTRFIFDKDTGFGLNPPENYVDMSTKGETVSLESIAAMDLDYMFVANINGSYEQLWGYLEDLEDNTVWNSLKAVKNDQMYALDSSIAAGGPLGVDFGVKTIIDSLTN